MPPREYWETTGPAMPYTREHWETTGTATTYNYDNIVMPETHLTINADDLRAAVAPNVIGVNTTLYNAPVYITSNDLDKFAERVYRIIADHTKIDISENEFMDIIKGENNE